MSVRAPVGDINMAKEACCLGRGVAALRHNSGSRSFTYYAIKAIQKSIAAFDDDGTVFGAINRKQFESLPMTDPGARLSSAFDRVASPLDRRIELALDEVTSLTELRDTLLPKLISGELSIAEIKLNAAVA